jgi:hypothetical protein
MKQLSKSTEAWVADFDNTLADVRVAAGIAHAACLALASKEDLQRDPLAYALNYVCDACSRCESFLEEIDRLRTEEA